MNETLLHFSRELASIAQAGLTYGRDPYDVERYRRLREMAGELLAAEGAPDFRWPEETGYSTPKVDVRAVVVRDDEVLLVRETASGKWTLPGGWADVNLSPAANAEKECREESGYEVRAVRLVAVIDRETAGYPMDALTIYKMFFLCEITGGAPATSIESSGVGFFPVSDLPELDPHRARKEDILHAVEASRNPDMPPRFN